MKRIGKTNGMQLVRLRLYVETGRRGLCTMKKTGRLLVLMIRG